MCEYTSEFKNCDGSAPIGIENQWSCPRDPVNGYRFCPFHLPLEEKPSECDLQEKVRNALHTESETANVFIGAIFDDLNLKNIQVSHENEIRFDGARIAGSLQLDNASVAETISLSNARIEGHLSVSHATVDAFNLRGVSVVKPIIALSKYRNYMGSNPVRQESPIT